MVTLRHALGASGRATSMRSFAAELGLSPMAYRHWEARGSYPGHAKLTESLARVAAVRDGGLDAAALAVWAETGQGEAPLEPRVIPPKPADPERAPGERTPLRLSIEAIGRLTSVAKSQASADPSGPVDEEVRRLADVIVELSDVLRVLELARARTTTSKHAGS